MFTVFKSGCITLLPWIKHLWLGHIASNWSTFRFDIAISCLKLIQMSLRLNSKQLYIPITKYKENQDAVKTSQLKTTAKKDNKWGRFFLWTYQGTSGPCVNLQVIHQSTHHGGAARTSISLRAVTVWREQNKCGVKQPYLLEWVYECLHKTLVSSAHICELNYINVLIFYILVWSNHIDKTSWMHSVLVRVSIRFSYDIVQFLFYFHHLFGNNSDV